MASLLIRSACGRGRWQRSRVRRVFDHLLSFFFLSLFTFLGLFAWQKENLVSSDGRIIVEVGAIIIIEPKESINGRSLIEKRDPMAVVIPKFITIVEHHFDHWSDLPVQCALPLFLRKLIWDDVDIFRLRWNRNSASVATRFAVFASGSNQMMKHPPLWLKRLFARSMPCGEQIQWRSTQTNIERQCGRAPTILQVQFESNWPVRGQIFRHCEVGNSPIFASQSHGWSLTKFKIMSSQVVSLDHFARHATRERRIDYEYEETNAGYDCVYLFIGIALFLVAIFVTIRGVFQAAAAPTINDWCRGLALLLGQIIGPLGLTLAYVAGASLFGFAPSGESLFLRSVVRMRLFVIAPALATEEEKDRLSVFSHRDLPHLKKRPSLGPTIIRNIPSGNDLFSRGDTPPKQWTIAFVKTPNAVLSSQSGNLNSLASTEMPVGLAPMLSVDGNNENGGVSFGFIGSGRLKGQLALESTSMNSIAKDQHSGSSLTDRTFTILALGPSWSALTNSSAGMWRHATCSFSRPRWSSASACFCLACAVSSRSVSNSLKNILQLARRD